MPRKKSTRRRHKRRPSNGLLSSELPRLVCTSSERARYLRAAKAKGVSISKWVRETMKEAARGHVALPPKERGSYGLSRVRCTTTERDRYERLARRKGISLSRLVRYVLNRATGK